MPLLPGGAQSKFVTIVLTALAVLMTVLGIFIAGLAVWGYSQLRIDARNAAAQMVKDYLNKTAPKLVSSSIAGYDQARVIMAKRPGRTREPMSLIMNKTEN